MIDLKGIWTWITGQGKSFWGLVLAAAFAGEYVKPARMISNFLEGVFN
jgi:hypothetical protein